MPDKRTPWFPPEIKPVREGWYECHRCGPNVRHYFTGTRWPNMDDPQHPADRFPFMWRGLRAPSGEGR